MHVSARLPFGERGQSVEIADRGRGNVAATAGIGPLPDSKKHFGPGSPAAVECPALVATSDEAAS